MIRRSRRSLPAALVALVLLVGSVLVAISCIQLLLSQPPVVPFAAIAETASTITWNQPAVLVAAAVVAVLGLILLAVALIPGRPTVLGLAHRDGQPDAGATCHSLAQAVAGVTRTVDGVDSARVRLRPHTITATVQTSLREKQEIPEQVRAAIVERLDDIALARPPRIRVRVRTARSDQ
jgi:copper chaperone CopZ